MVDISLSALRMGAQEVNLVCLERRNEMLRLSEEIEEAEEEGIRMHPGLGPKRMVGKTAKWLRSRPLKQNGFSTKTNASHPAVL